MADWIADRTRHPECPRCGRPMDYGVGCTQPGNRWVQWRCPRCREGVRVEYDAPTCHHCGVEMRRVLDGRGRTVAWACPECHDERRAV